MLIPYRKQDPEAFKSALELLQTDQGGLVFAPIVGYHEQVGELDFSSMYPSIMVRFNISPETVNCRCCRDEPTARVDGRFIPQGYTRILRHCQQELC